MHNEEWIKQINELRLEFETDPGTEFFAQAFERTWEIEFDAYSEMQKLAAFHVATFIMQEAWNQQDERRWHVASGLTLAMIRKWDLAKMKKAIGVRQLNKWTGRVIN